MTLHVLWKLYCDQAFVVITKINFKFYWLKNIHISKQYFLKSLSCTKIFYFSYG